MCFLQQTWESRTTISSAAIKWSADEIKLTSRCALLISWRFARPGALLGRLMRNTVCRKKSHKPQRNQSKSAHNRMAITIHDKSTDLTEQIPTDVHPGLLATILLIRTNIIKWWTICHDLTTTQIDSAEFPALAATKSESLSKSQPPTFTLLLCLFSLRCEGFVLIRILVSIYLQTTFYPLCNNNNICETQTSAQSYLGTLNK